MKRVGEDPASTMTSPTDSPTELGTRAVGFGALLRAHRAAAGLTQAELADRAGVSERAVSDIERGLRTRIYPVTAKGLADALGLDAVQRATLAAAIRPPRESDTQPPGVEEWLALRRTPIVGRAEELGQLRALLADPGARIVTVTGAGGVGKSRLAAEACAEPPRERVAWVSLAPLRDPALALPTIAATFGLPRDVPAAPLARVLNTYELVVLDTFETVVDAAGSLAALIDQTARCTVVVTSRVPLRVRGERELSMSGLATSEAAALFQARVRDIRSSALTGVTGDVLGRIAERLAGLPLALELAAARTRRLSVPGLLDALDRPLQVLGGGARDLPERQRTMRATIDWSYELLGSEERAAMCQLSVFASGWMTAQAATLCSRDFDEMTDVLERLAEHGLLVAEPDGDRWRQPDPVRDYARERLAPEERRAYALRHASVITDEVEQTAPLLLGAEQAEARAVLRARVDDVRSAFSTAVDAGETHLALRLAAAAWMFWRLEGAFDEGSRLLTTALALPGVAAEGAWTRAVWGRAWIAYQQGDVEVVASYADRLVNHPGRAERRNGLTLLGHLAIAGGDIERALETLRAALVLAREDGDPWIVATSHLNLGTALVHQPDPEGARQVLTDALAGHEELGDLLFASRDRLQLAYTAVQRGGHVEADELVSQAFEDLLDRNDPWGVADALAAFSVVRAARGDAEGAAILSGAAAAAWQRVGAHVLRPDANLGATYLAEARTRLGKAAWTAAEQRGENLSPSAAVAAMVAFD